MNPRPNIAHDFMHGEEINCFASEMILRCLGIIMSHNEMINNFKEINSEVLTWVHSHCLRGTVLEIKSLKEFSSTYFLLCSHLFVWVFLIVVVSF